MGELELSNNLKQIELEITHHKQVAGQSIWEIGRRLNHVKENDLAHGQFGKWLEEIDINHNTANRFMKVAKEIPNSDTYHNLGTNALYLIATLPDEQKEKELKKAEEGEPSTTQELKEVKRQLKEKDKQLEQAQRSEELAVKRLEREQNKEPEVIEKEIEVTPPDYEELKQSNQQLNEQLERMQESVDYAEERYEHLLHQREEVHEKSTKYDQLTEAIEDAEGQLNEKQRLVSNYKNVLSLLREANDAVIAASPVVYTDFGDLFQTDRLVSEELDRLIDRTQKLTDDLRALKKESRIIEGEIINE